MKLFRNTAYFLTVILVTGLVSCGPENAAKSGTKTVEDSTQVSGKSDAKIREALATRRKSKSVDSARLRFDAMPITTAKHDAEFYESTKNLLFPGIFHHNEIWEGFVNQTWFGLYKRDSGYTLELVAPSLKSVVDIVSDEEGDTTGWDVSVPDADRWIVLISDTSLKAQTVTWLPMKHKTLWPKDTVRFTFSNVVYELIAKGQRYPDVADAEYYDAKNYEMVFRQVDLPNEKEQVLFNHIGLNDASIQVRWIGGLNNDGRPDLLIETSGHYNMSLPTLFLSGGAEGKDLLKMFGKFNRVGC